MRDHAARAFLDAAELAAVAHRPPHLLRELGHRLLVHGKNRLEEAQHRRLALRERHGAPRRLRRPGRRDHARRWPPSATTGRRTSSRPSMGEMQMVSVMGAWGLDGAWGSVGAWDAGRLGEGLADVPSYAPRPTPYVPRPR